MFAAAIIAGAVGGLVFEVMPGRTECHLGAIRTPHRLKGRNFIELGFVSNVLLGAVTAVAILYFFPPATEIITVNEQGARVTSYSYDLVKLISLSLIVGSAGPSFLSSIQGRLAGALNAQKQDMARTTSEELDKVHKDADTTVSAVAHDKRQKVEAVIRETVKPMNSAAASTVTVNGNGNVTLEEDQPASGVSASAEDLISKLHAICDSAEDELKKKMDAVVEEAKKSIKEKMGLD